MPKIISTAQTHCGQRANNQDSHCEVPEHGLYIVADGMGGYTGGEEASRIAVESIVEFFASNAEDGGFTWPFGMDTSRSLLGNMVSTSIRIAHREIASKQIGEKRSMGSTVVVLAVREDELVVGHVGDSRVYRFREGVLTQLTRDHSLYNELVAQGHPNLPPLRDFQHGNVITKALGMTGGERDSDVLQDKHQPGDVYLLCSDGLIECLEDNDLAVILTEEETLEEACERLVQEAVSRGVRDNTTALLVGME